MARLDAAVTCARCDAPAPALPTPGVNRYPLRGDRVIVVTTDRPCERCGHDRIKIRLAVDW